MNAYFLRAAFPSLPVETQPDWEDRIAATEQLAPAPNEAENASLRAMRERMRAGARAWLFDTVLFSDRSAAFRGEECGSRTQRTAAEAHKAVAPPGSSFLERGWWEPVRRKVLQFAGVDDHTLDIGARAFAEPGGRQKDEDIVVTYISRQGVRRHLIYEDHEGLAKALEEVCTRRGWELNVVAMERMSKEEQLAVVARTTVRTPISLLPRT